MSLNRYVAVIPARRSGKSGTPLDPRTLVKIIKIKRKWYKFWQPKYKEMYVPTTKEDNNDKTTATK